MPEEPVSLREGDKWREIMMMGEIEDQAVVRRGISRPLGDPGNRLDPKSLAQNPSLTILHSERFVQMRARLRLRAAPATADSRKVHAQAR
jgi:hypothetical protein